MTRIQSLAFCLVALALLFLMCANTFRMMKVLDQMEANLATIRDRP